MLFHLGHPFLITCALLYPLPRPNGLHVEYYIKGCIPLKNSIYIFFAINETFVLMWNIKSRASYRISTEKLKERGRYCNHHLVWKDWLQEDEFNKTTTIHERGMKHFIYIDHGIPPCVRSKWTVCSSPFLAAWCNGVPQNDPANGKWGGLET